MSNRSASSPVIVLAIFAVIVFFMGRMAWQWFTAPEQEPGPSLPEQLEAIPGVEHVEVKSHHIPGSSDTGSLGTSSTVVFGPEVLDDPAGTAKRLSEVTFGFHSSDWSIEGTTATADVHYLNRTDPAPYAWFLGAAAALQEVRGADLSCDIRYGSLDCEVAGGDERAVTKALAHVDGTAIQPWVEANRPDPDQPHGFRLRVGGEEFTDPTALR